METEAAKTARRDAGESSEPLLRIRNLKTHFFTDDGVVRAVDGVSLEVYRGRCLCVVGESGSGKSITAFSVLRLLPKAGRIVEGEIWLRDAEHSRDLVPLADDGPEIRAIRGNQVAMIFQEPMTSFSPVHTVGNQIAEAIALHRNLKGAEKRQASIEAMQHAQVPEPEKRFQQYPHELSGGLRQRCMIAMALACQPKLLLADEPTTALDVTIQAQILELLRDLQQRDKMGLLLITHDLGVVAEMADDVAVMYLGRVVEQAPVAELFRNPQHPYTIALLQSLPKLQIAPQGDLQVLPGSVPDPHAVIPGCPFHPRCAEAVKGTCDQGNIPPLLKIGQNHRCACWLRHNKEGIDE